MRTAPVLLAALAVLLAGCATPQAAHGGHEDSLLDTGDIAPGASATLTFAHVGQLAIHCHPHPFMEHAVTVTDDAPTEAHVHIHDGEQPGDYRFEPANLTVGAGSVVTYHNHGTLTHTATQM
jgi:plastocyanin